MRPVWATAIEVEFADDSTTTVKPRSWICRRACRDPNGSASPSYVVNRRRIERSYEEARWKGRRWRARPEEEHAIQEGTTDTLGPRMEGCYGLELYSGRRPSNDWQIDHRALYQYGSARKLAFTVGAIA